MKKVFIIMIIAVFMLSGCGDDKNVSTTQSTNEEVTATPVQQTPQPEESPIQTTPTAQPTQPAAAQQDTASAAQTKEELEELSDTLEGLTGGDFSDIDYSE